MPKPRRAGKKESEPAALCDCDRRQNILGKSLSLKVEASARPLERTCCYSHPPFCSLHELIPLYNAAWLAPPPVLLITVFLGSPPLSITHILCLLCCFFGHSFEASSFHNFFVAAFQFRHTTAVWCPSDSFIPHTMLQLQHQPHQQPPLAAAWC